jgi:hypothetical protein
LGLTRNDINSFFICLIISYTVVYPDSLPRTFIYIVEGFLVWFCFSRSVYPVQKYINTKMQVSICKHAIRVMNRKHKESGERLGHTFLTVLLFKEESKLSTWLLVLHPKKGSITSNGIFLREK